jgi:hypothetical protein
MEPAVGIVLEALVAAEDADQVVDAVVVGRDVLVADRPVVAQPVVRLPLEVTRAEAQRDAPPVVGAPAEHAPAPPVEARAGARVYGSPSISKPPSHASCSPNSRARVARPRRGVA